MKTLLLAAAAVGALVVSGPARADEPAKPAPPPPVVSVPTYANASCPIMGKPASKVLYTDTDWGRVYVCCAPCMKKIQQDPQRAAQAAYPVVKKAGNVLDPVTNQPVGDKPYLIVLQGWEIALSSEDNAKTARADSQITLAKALDPAVVEVGNHTDPLTGRPVVANAFVLLDKNLVRLSGPDGVAEVKKDPQKALDAARKIAAKEAEERAKAKETTPPR
jgi:hypothetical protein